MTIAVVVLATLWLYFRRREQKRHEQQPPRIIRSVHFGDDTTGSQANQSIPTSVRSIAARPRRSRDELLQATKSMLNMLQLVPPAHARPTVILAN